MLDHDSDLAAVLEDVWRRLDQIAHTGDVTLAPRDHAILAVLYLSRHCDLSVKQARALVRESGYGAVPSEATVSRHRARLEPALAVLLATEGSANDATEMGEWGERALVALRAAMRGWSYPAFCERLRRDHGLLCDATLLQRAANPRHPRALSPAVATTILRHLAPPAFAGELALPRRRARNRPAARFDTLYQPLSPTEAARRLRDALAYEKRLPGEPGAFALHLWCLTAGEAREVDLLVERLRAWIRRKASRDPPSVSWDAATMLDLAWREVTRAHTLYRSHGSRHKQPASPAWSDLTTTQRRALATLAALPGRAWSAAELSAIAAPAGHSALEVARLVVGAWLMPVPGMADTYISPPGVRHHVRRQSESRHLALEGLACLWRDLLLPRLRAACGSFKTLTDAFEHCAGAALVTDCLDLAGSAVRDDEEVAQSADTAELWAAGDLLRWMWRPLSDVLGPAGYVALHVAMAGLADRALTLLGESNRTASSDRGGRVGAEHSGWAGLEAEHTLMVAERVFFEHELRQTRACRATLSRAELLLPSLDAILARMGAERECLLTACLSAIEYGIYLAWDDAEALSRRERVPPGSARAVARRLATLRARLTDLADGEDADARAKGLDARERWNYPALARWDRGRTQATYAYWSSLSLLAEARVTRLSDHIAAAELFQQAAATADRATRLYQENARENGKWDRAVHALLHQGEIAREAGRPAQTALWMLRAATQALEKAMEGETRHLALTCQLAAAEALRHLASLYPRQEQAGGDQRDRGGSLSGQEARDIIAQIDHFARIRRGYLKDEVPEWAGDLSIVAAPHGEPIGAAHCAEGLSAWSAAFLRAVERIAAAQPPAARRETLERIRAIAPDWEFSIAPPPRRHRAHRPT